MKSHYIQIGKLIRTKRLQQNLSQDELAWRCDLNTNSLGRIERAEGEFKVSTLFRIFKELKINFSELQKISGYQSDKQS